MARVAELTGALYFEADPFRERAVALERQHPRSLERIERLAAVNRSGNPPGSCR
jgi:hypothetical protein